MNTLSDTIRELMDRHNLTGVKLAEEIGISAVSVSNILTGKSRPRQVTLSRMIKRLCESPEDEQALLGAYENLGDAQMSTTPVVDDEENSATEEERVRRFLEMKARAVSFRRDVAMALDRIRVSYRPEVARGPVITDLLIEHGGKRIALECRANVKRDLEKSLVSARIIRDELKCDQVFIVVPEFDGDLREACTSERYIRELELKRLTRELTVSLNLS
jgi:transcriptional regulator with XRE-family HTH domain